MVDTKLKRILLSLLLFFVCLNLIYLSKPAMFNDRLIIWKLALFPSKALQMFTSSVSNFVKTTFYAREVINENRELKKRLDTLTIENLILKRELENSKSIKTVEDYIKKFPFTVEISTVVARNPQFWHQYLLIDGGKDKGFLPGMPVITKDGLIGKIVEVFDGYSKVLLLIDPEFSVDVRGDKSNVLALCSGIGTSVMKINYVPKFEELELGETVVTSGLDGAFPEGIPVGYVMEINKPFGDYFLDAYVIPVVDVLKIKEVIVIKNFAKKQK